MAYPIWQATITDDNGNVLPGAEITVVNETTGLNAPLYSTRNGTSKTNPFFATVDGFAQFYAEPGLYRITATDGGTGTTQTFRYVRLVEVATNAEARAGTAGVLLDAAGGHAAFGQYGLGSKGTSLGGNFDLNSQAAFIDGSWRLEASPVNGPSWGTSYCQLRVTRSAGDTINQTVYGYINNRISFRTGVTNLGNKEDIRNKPWLDLLHTGNTTVDPNGFIKAASPIVNVYRDRAESNGSAELEEMQFERISTGHYRLTGVPELSRDGWYIETPKDRNGNVYFTIDYTESEGQLDIRTYTPDYSTGRAENGAPVDIIDGRFVSLRFAASPETTTPEEA